MGVLSAATQTTYTRPTVSPLGARISASSGGATYVKTTSGSIITVVPKSLATLGGKIISSNIVSGQSHVSSVIHQHNRIRLKTQSTTSLRWQEPQQRSPPSR